MILEAIRLSIELEIDHRAWSIIESIRGTIIADGFSDLIMLI